MINGVIEGFLKVYLSFGYAVPFLSLGFSIHQLMPWQGDDPHCMCGWSNAPKLAFFVPLLFFAALAQLFTSITMVDLNASRVRFRHTARIISELTIAVFGLTSVFLFTWLFGATFYLRWAYKDVANFYPAFSVLVSWSGLLTFLTVGGTCWKFLYVLKEFFQWVGCSQIKLKG